MVERDANGESKETRRIRNARDHNRAARREYAKTPEGRAAQKRAIEKYRASNPEKVQAHERARDKDGEGRKCARCDAKAVHKHHHKGYKTDAVTWLCHAHHVKAHHPKSNITEKAMHELFQEILSKNIASTNGMPNEAEAQSPIAAGAHSEPGMIGVSAPESPGEVSVDMNEKLQGQAVGEPEDIGDVAPIPGSAGGDGVVGMAKSTEPTVTGIWAHGIFFPDAFDRRVSAAMSKGNVTPEPEIDPRSMLTKATLCKACKSAAPAFLAKCPKCGSNMKKSDVEAGSLRLGPPVRLPHGASLVTTRVYVDGSLPIK